MLLMQYRFDFADEHDMASVRARISRLGPGFDALAGLIQKAFFVSSLETGGANRYAPFYVWQDDEAMRAFLLSDAFARVCARYGRPVVHAWPALYSTSGNASRIPSLATQELVPVEASTDLAVLASHERAEAEAAGHDRSLHSIHVGLDTTTWQLSRTCFWHRMPARKAGVDTYDIGYLAFPRHECLSP